VTIGELQEKCWTISRSQRLHSPSPAAKKLPCPRRDRYPQPKRGLHGPRRLQQGPPPAPFKQHLKVIICNPRKSVAWSRRRSSRTNEANTRWILGRLCTVWSGHRHTLRFGTGGQLYMEHRLLRWLRRSNQDCRRPHCRNSASNRCNCDRYCNRCLARKGRSSCVCKAQLAPKLAPAPFTIAWSAVG
jgi:hypothetical protein